MAYDINKIRQNIAEATGKRSDPDEFRPDKAKPGAELKYRFFILPPLQEGDQLKSGVVQKSMDNFFISNGQHWVNDKPHACPRLWDGSKCAICDVGFLLLKECKNKNFGDERRKQISSQWMPATYFMVNIFFTNSKTNPEDLRGKTRFYNASKTCLDKWQATLYKDDKGDDEDPQAYGVFFDESAGFCFELVATKNGNFNDYKTSGFLKNNGTPVPMIQNEDKTPNKKAIEALLRSRIDLWSKVQVPDTSKIERLAATMMSGDDDDGISTGGGFDSDETEENPKAKPIQARKPKNEDIIAEDLSDEEKAPKLKSKPKAKAEEDLSDEEEAPRSKAKPKADDDEEEAPKPTTKPKPDDDDDDDISALLGQLDD